MPPRPFVDYFNKGYLPPQDETRLWVSVQRSNYENEDLRLDAAYHLWEGYGVSIYRAKPACGGKKVLLKAGCMAKSKGEIAELVKRWFGEIQPNRGSCYYDW